MMPTLVESQSETLAGKANRLRIAFNKPFMTGEELSYIQQAHAQLHLSGNGPFTKKCQKWIENSIGARKAFLTHSGTSALEMAALLANIGPGDEVIMPSYTFVSTANAFVLRGAVPVFVDIRSDTLNMDESKIEEAVTKRTKAIVPVHYGGVGCPMDVILSIASRHKLLVIEDAAHCMMASYQGKPLGSFGHLAALSFHETKNIICGEGGALLVNETSFESQAEIVWEKGTNRSKFFRGQVDKYTWIDKGSSYLPSELNAAFLYAQMKEAENITRRRLEIWDRYHAAFLTIADREEIQAPLVPAECQHNAHLYYLLLPNRKKRDQFISLLKKRGIEAVFHYVPLHSSPAGKKYGRSHGNLETTQNVSDRLVRLPLWVGLEDCLDDLIQEIMAVLKSL